MILNAKADPTSVVKAFAKALNVPFPDIHFKPFHYQAETTPQEMTKTVCGLNPEGVNLVRTKSKVTCKRCLRVMKSW